MAPERTDWNAAADAGSGLPAMLRSVGRTYADKAAVITNDETITFGSLVQRVSRFADFLSRSGVHHGDRVAILDVNSLDFLEAVCALGMLGAAAVPLNFRQRVPEHRFQIENSGARLLLTSSRYANKADRLSSNLELGWCALDAGATVAARNGTGETDEGDRRPVEPSTPLAICYTSGTTGQPKGAVISQHTCYMRALKLNIELRLGPEDVLHSPTPMFHISCLNLSLMALMRGTTQLILPQFEANETMTAVRRHGVTFMNVVPTMFSKILETPDCGPETFGDLRLIMYTAAPIGVPLLHEVMSTYRGGLIQFLGQTEDLPQTVLTPHDHREALTGNPERLKSIGRPSMGVELRICDEEGAPRPPGDVGEIVTRGGTAMSGYWELPEESARTLRDGWIFSGDLGYQDEQGYVYLAGRKKQMIIRGGENIYPAEVERVLIEAPGVRDGVVLGFPDATWGEIVVAVVVTDRPPPSPEEITAHCRRSLASFRCPERIVYRDELPYNAAGKVLRHVLKAELAKETTGQGTFTTAQT
jgi:acyl-CoA synthetase (AMP-forming)/AMP-acid ligase II